MRRRECTCGWYGSGSHELSCGLPDVDDEDFLESLDELEGVE